MSNNPTTDAVFRNREIAEALDKLEKVVEANSEILKFRKDKYLRTLGKNIELEQFLKEKDSQLESLRLEKSGFELISKETRNYTAEIETKLAAANLKIYEITSTLKDSEDKIASFETLLISPTGNKLQVEYIDSLEADLKKVNERDKELSEENTLIRQRLIDMEKLKEEHSFTQKELTRRNFQLHENNDTITKLRERVAELESFQIKYSNTIESLKTADFSIKTLNDKIIEYENLTAEKERFEAEYRQDSDNKISALNDQFSNIKTELDSKQAELKSAYNQIENLNKEISEIRNNADKLKENYENQITNLNKKITDLSRLNQSLTDELSLVRQGLSLIDNQSGEFSKQVESLNDIIKTRTNELESSNIKISVLELQLNDSEQTKSELLEKSTTLSASLSTANKSIIELNRVIQDMKNEMLLISDNIQKERETSLKLTRQIKELQNENYALERKKSELNKTHSDPDTGNLFKIGINVDELGDTMEKITSQKKLSDSEKSDLQNEIKKYMALLEPVVKSIRQ
ncbi:MAG: family ATPase [Ignavibacteria bacterium]|nr:family ATPase [Ignavibacteria bacterium]